MPARKEPQKPNSVPRQPSASTPEGREQQMISYADRLAEQQLLDGTASSMVITHYLKLGTSTTRLEQEKIHNENLRLQAQIMQMESQANSAEMYDQVLAALKLYSGASDDDDD